MSTENIDLAYGQNFHKSEQIPAFGTNETKHEPVVATSDVSGSYFLHLGSDICR